MRVCLFTDTLADVNGVSRFIRNIAACALETGRDLRVATSTRLEAPAAPNIANFAPVLARKMPGYAELEIVLPPARAMLRHARALRPDVIHVSTPGPVGMVGLLASRVLGVPVAGVYHTDFPAYVERLFREDALTAASEGLMRAFYRPFAAVFTRSAAYAGAVAGLGVAPERIVRLRPGIDVEAFHPRYREAELWGRFAGVGAGSVKVLYAGRVSVEKNLPMLAGVWKRVRGVCRERGLDAELIVVGDGPYRAAMERELAGAGAHFLGFRHGEELSAIYASSDLFAFPSTTDTLGQVVMEAQSSGLPVLVTDEGGPKEVVSDRVTGLVLPARDGGRWAGAIVGLVEDAARRRAMGAAAHEAMRGMSIGASFEAFWETHRSVLRAEG